MKLKLRLGGSYSVPHPILLAVIPASDEVVCGSLLEMTPPFLIGRLLTVAGPVVSVCRRVLLAHIGHFYRANSWPLWDAIFDAAIDRHFT